MINFLNFLILPIGMAFLLAAILGYAIWTKSIPETFLAVVLIVVLAFYYAESANFTVFALRFIPGFTIADGLQKYRSFVAAQLPNSGTLVLLGRSFSFGPLDDHVSTTRWPALLLIAGSAVRLGFARYVSNPKLKRIGSEYWLFITTYFVLAAVVSDLLHWSFPKIVLTSVVVVLVLIAGLFKIFVDITHFCWQSLEAIRKSLKIVVIHITFRAAQFVKILRNLINVVRTMYEKYISEPIKRFFARIHNALDQQETDIRGKLDKEKLDD